MAHDCGSSVGTITFIFFTAENQNESILLQEKTNCIIQNAIPYVNDSSPYHLMDAYIPDGNGPFPAIVYIHGGGWVEGNRSDFNTTALLYAKRGIAGFSIDYTIAPPNSTAWPKNIQDVVSALQFIRENAQVFNIDKERIALMGSSAGAHLASLIGTISGDESFISKYDGSVIIRNQILLVINYDGVTDLEYIGEYWNPSFIYKIVTSAFGNVSYTQNSTLWREASPASYITPDGPIFVFIHGSNDIIVPIPVAESFNSKLENAGIETYFIRIDGDHDILTNETWNLQARYSLDPLLRQIFCLK